MKKVQILMMLIQIYLIWCYELWSWHKYKILQGHRVYGNIFLCDYEVDTNIKFSEDIMFMEIFFSATMKLIKELLSEIMKMI